MQILITLLSLFQIAIAAPVVEDCPIEGSETAAAPCADEQAEVEAALMGKETMKLLSYCLKAAPGTDGQGIQCRGPAIYKETASGNFTDELFEDRFTASEIDRAVYVRVYFVKQSNGKYNTYMDRTTDGVLNIDKHTTLDRDLVVTFDSANRPSFTAEFLTIGVGTTSTKTLTHFGTHADLVNNADGSVKRYHVLNPEQM
ncbi:MAG: hypothetical protein AAF203_05910 [Pseudomonadota bacterium]